MSEASEKLKAWLDEIDALGEGVEALGIGEDGPRVTVGDLRALLAERTWRPIERELPPEGVQVLLTDGKVMGVAALRWLKITGGQWAGTKTITWDPDGHGGPEWEWEFNCAGAGHTYDGVTHWMPLPEPPKVSS